ncbi:MAG: 5'-nucleotidase C-terminal domain-containing protein, partial [Pseudomonadota bacterium]|nr:5'-nucleotidase C-terminal domain-containing protein [Pseudomonadota bacterium]
YLFKPGKGVHEIWINDRILADEKLYWVASSNFVIAGGDGYSEFEHAIERVDTGEQIVDIVEDFLVRKKIYRPVYEDRLISK